jgi:hypothetical protein
LVPLWPFADLEAPTVRLARRQLPRLALIPGVGEDRVDEREAPPAPAGQQPYGAVAVLHARRLHGDAQQQREVIGEDVALDPLDLLDRILADRVDRRPPFGRFGALAVDDRRRRARLPALLLAQSLIERLMDALERTVPRP